LIVFWIIRGIKEYKFIYKKSLSQELLDLGFTEDKLKKIHRNIRRSLFKKISTHFGQPYLNSATIAGLFRMMIKQISRKNLNNS